METKISCSIDNLIQNYCYNFLSYLYPNDGWNRTMFDIGKEVFIPSCIESGKQIRIFISNTGRILINCSFVSDIPEAIDFIQKCFENARMYYICYDEKVVIKTEFKNEIYVDILNGEEYFENEYGKILVSENMITLIYNKYENKNKLLEYLEIEELIDDEGDGVIEEGVGVIQEGDGEGVGERNEEMLEEGNEIVEGDCFMEGLLFTSFLFWMSARFAEYL